MNAQSLVDPSDPTNPTASNRRSVTRLLVANRGEVAIRIARAAEELGIDAVTVYPADDAGSSHVGAGVDSSLLPGVGTAAYLDVDALVEAALATDCQAVHPGYGFASENPLLAERCEAAGLIFIGPPAAVLRLFGDKASGRALADRCGVPILSGSDGAVDVESAREFLARLGPGGAVVLKAVAGGGGRGMRVVRTTDELDEAFDRAHSEALSAFGNGDLIVEQLVTDARHIEVQILGDQIGDVTHLWERECSLQRRHQKLIESAPASNLDPVVRQRLLDSAIVMADEIGYVGVGTFEFLVHDQGFAFIEANPRLQVEHTVTEEITGVDLVRASIELAMGMRLADIGLGPDSVPAPRGTAIQARVNAEQLAPDGAVYPSGGVLNVFEAPAGPGIRVDTYGCSGYHINPRYDSLIAKVIAHGMSRDIAVSRLSRALGELRTDGVETNAAFLQAVLAHPDVIAGDATTTFIGDHLDELVAALPTAVSRTITNEGSIVAPMPGVVLDVLVTVGDVVATGRNVAVLESMKMEHFATTDVAGIVRSIDVERGDTVVAGQLLISVEPADIDIMAEQASLDVDLDVIPARLAELLERKAKGDDASRPDAVAKRHAAGGRTAYENVADLCDPGSFVEYGGLVVAAQRQKRSSEELAVKTPHDGIVTGVGAINGEMCVILAYDYTVLAGTQGYWGHKKKDRMLAVAGEQRMPVVLYAEGGGGRAGDTDFPGASELDTATFRLLGRLSGQVPLVGIVNGLCFAGNAVLLGECDVIIATRASNIGIGGPSMIEGAGLGVVTAREIGPYVVHVDNGVIDISVDDEVEATEVARKYLSYFQGPVDEWDCTDQRKLRHILPENRRRIYEIREVLSTLADIDSVLELRPEFGRTMVTALARIAGRPVGVIANDPRYLSGAIDSDGADKCARFLQLCDTFGLPVVSLCDCPGIMVGVEAEKSALVRHASRAMLTAVNLSVPLVTLVIRRCYGIGGQVMAGGHTRAPLACVSWPGGEFGAMGHEGTVQLIHGAELAAIADPDERARLTDELVAQLYEETGAINVATLWEIDDVIDPADSRRWILAALEAAGNRRPDKVRPFVDAW